MGVGQWLPMTGDFSPPRGHLAMSEDSFGCHDLDNASGVY